MLQMLITLHLCPNPDPTKRLAKCLEYVHPSPIQLSANTEDLSETIML